MLCIKTERFLRNDFTVSHNKRLYQILDKPKSQWVCIEEHLDKRLLITDRGRKLRHQLIQARPTPNAEPLLKLKKLPTPKPPKEHPLKQGLFERRVRQLAIRKERTLATATHQTGHFNFGEKRTF